MIGYVIANAVIWGLLFAANFFVAVRGEPQVVSFIMSGLMLIFGIVVLTM